MNLKNIHQHIYLIRHGETEWTQLKKHTGLTDIPLNDAGKEQAAWLKERLSSKKFKKIFCSPLERAKETCALTGLLNSAEIDPDLVEWDYGDYEGKTSAEIRTVDPKWTIFSKGAPNGESIGDISARTMRVIGRLRAVPGDVAVFSSGHFLRSLGARWLKKPIGDGKHYLLSTASICVLGFEKESPVFMSWNQTES